MNKATLCSVKDCEQDRTKHNSKCAEHTAEVKSAWHLKNRESVLAKMTEYRQRNEGKVFVESDGYQMYVGFNHPAANPCGVTRLHRLVLWNKLNGQDAPCDECKRPLFWDKTQISSKLDELQVDHLNEIKDDNRPENLVPICLVCNTKRARRNKVKRMTDNG